MWFSQNVKRRGWKMNVSIKNFSAIVKVWICLLWGWGVILFERRHSVCVLWLLFLGKNMSRFREALKEDDTGKKNSKMPQKQKKKEAENKVWLFRKKYLQ